MLPLLGVESDGFLARNAGIRRAAVWQMRRRRGIPAATKQVPPEDADEPTAEEVERIVAEQSKCLPAWWGREDGG